MQDENLGAGPRDVTPDPSSDISGTSVKAARYKPDPRFLISRGSPVKIELSPEALNVFNQIMNMTQDDPADIVRKAISLYKVALEAHQEEKAVGAASNSEVLDTEFIGF